MKTVGQWGKPTFIHRPKQNPETPKKKAGRVQSLSLATRKPKVKLPTPPWENKK